MVKEFSLSCAPNYHFDCFTRYLKNPFGNVEFMTDFLKKRALYALGLKGNLQGIANVSHPQLAVRRQIFFVFALSGSAVI